MKLDDSGLPLLKRERTLAVTVGPWGGVWFTGKRRLIWRLCLGFVAITYVPAEMSQILDVWLRYGPIPDADVARAAGLAADRGWKDRP